MVDIIQVRIRQWYLGLLRLKITLESLYFPRAGQEWNLILRLDRLDYLDKAATLFSLDLGV